tara:strand:+ start:3178 stop:3846 length:669 start_codon:yes stop_codon:yes gene_type:complete
LFLFSKLEKSYSNSKINEIVVLSDFCYSDNFVSDILKKMKQKLDTLKLKDIILNDVEDSLINEQNIESAEVYFTIDKNLNIYLKERLPIVKIYHSNGERFFLDTNFHRIEDGKVYDLNYLIANGFINNKNLSFIYEISKSIYFDIFWRNFVSQVYVTEHNTIELIPVLFDHKIIIDNVKQLETAKIFYSNLTSEINISKYSELNFMFGNQVLAVKNNINYEK